MDKKNLKVDLKKRRKSLGLTQEELAEKLNVAVTTIQKWEQRKANIGSKYLLPFAKAINLDPMEIIDPDRTFPHYSDYLHVDGIKNINNIKKLCLNLEGDQIENVYNFAKVQLDEQKKLKITYEKLRAKSDEYDLNITMTVSDDSKVQELGENENYHEDFEGKVPKTYVRCMQFKTGKIMGFDYDQIVFLRTANVELMYSGVPVVAKKDNIIEIVKFRYVHNNMYMIPLTSTSSQKDESELGKKEEKYIWRETDNWKVLYLINQPAF